MGAENYVIKGVLDKNDVHDMEVWDRAEKYLYMNYTIVLDNATVLEMGKIYPVVKEYYGVYRVLGKFRDSINGYVDVEVSTVGASDEYVVVDDLSLVHMEVKKEMRTNRGIVVAEPGDQLPILSISGSHYRTDMGRHISRFIEDTHYRIVCADFDDKSEWYREQELKLRHVAYMKENAIRSDMTSLRFPQVFISMVCNADMQMHSNFKELRKGFTLEDMFETYAIDSVPIG